MTLWQFISQPLPPILYFFGGMFSGIVYGILGYAWMTRRRK